MRILSGAFVMVLFFFASSCKEERPLLIEEEKIVPILMDLHAISVVLERHTGLIRDSLQTTYREQMRAIHDISEVELETLLEYLKHNPDLSEVYYREVVDSVGARTKTE